MIEFLKDPAGVRRRIEAKVERQPDGCWLWQGSTNKKGYATIKIGSGVESVHVAARFAFIENRRTSYERFARVCDGPVNCVNPEHWQQNGAWRAKCAASARAYWADKSPEFRRARTQNKRDAEILFRKNWRQPRANDPYEASNNAIPPDLFDPSRHKLGPTAVCR